MKKSKYLFISSVLVALIGMNGPTLADSCSSVKDQSKCLNATVSNLLLKKLNKACLTKAYPTCGWVNNACTGVCNPDPDDECQKAKTQKDCVLPEQAGAGSHKICGSAQNTLGCVWVDTKTGGHCSVDCK